VMAPGHDAWVVGDEPCVVIDWQGFADYANDRRHKIDRVAGSNCQDLWMKIF